MPVHLSGITYFTNSEAAEHAAVTRQTIWRWRSEGRIPLGRQFRGKTVLFTQDEVDQIVNYANRVEPIGNSVLGQLNLFAKTSKTPPP